MRIIILPKRWSILVLCSRKTQALGLDTAQIEF